jgi:hypothetical protein
MGEHKSLKDGFGRMLAVLASDTAAGAHVLRTQTNRHTARQTQTDRQTETDRHTRARINHKFNELGQAGTKSPASDHSLLKYGDKRARWYCSRCSAQGSRRWHGCCQRPVGCGVLSGYCQSWCRSITSHSTGPGEQRAQSRLCTR